MKYEQGSEKVNMGAQNTVVSKPLPMTQDPQFAWLGIISLIGRGIVILVLLTPVIVGITAKSATNDGFGTAVMIGASIAFFILAIVIIVAFILT
ncbi:unnamed protein product, partial [Rotaria sp. Silwood1]